MIGLIIPPAQIKERAEKTAEYVANNGQQFEALVFQQEQTNPKFIFLHKDSPYRGYYDYMVNEYRKKLLEQQQKAKQQEQKHEQQQIENEDVKAQTVNAVQSQQRAFLEQAFQDIKAPDPEEFYAEMPEKLGLAEKEIIQHTAQYVAKNGRNFLMPLSDKQKNNPQFEFLKAGSDNFKYFTTLVDGYTKILNFTTNDVEKLHMMATDREYILSKCVEKFEYERRQMQSKNKKVDQQKEKDTNIDWNDFELVETIAFDDDHLVKSSNNVRDELRGMMRRTGYEGSDRPIEQIITSTKSKQCCNLEKQVLQQCAVCSRHIPISSMNHHLAVCMLDPKVKERKKQLQELKQATNAMDITQNLKSLQANRPDIFGAKDSGFQLQQPDSKPKIIWDGQAANMSRTTASIAMVEYQQKRQLEQMKQQQKK